MIEITKSPFSLSINDRKLIHATKRSSSSGLHITIGNEEESALFQEQLLADIPVELTRVTFENKNRKWIKNLRVIAELDQFNANGSWNFYFLFVFQIAAWKKPWSMGEVSQVIQLLLNERSDGGWAVYPSTQPSTRLVMRPNFFARKANLEPSRKIADQLNELLLALEALILEADQLLADRAKKDSLVALFDFPPSVSTPCEQYLLYFIQFLKDIGIEAHGDITHDAGQVMFSVTPASGKEALGKIKEALEVFLRLPGAPNVGDVVLHEANVPMQQLAANVQHLQGQLMLASAMIQSKEATIEAKEAVIESKSIIIAQLNSQLESQPRLITGDVMNSSLQLVETTDDREEDFEVIEGILKLKKYKGEGIPVELDLPELARRLKRLVSGSASLE